MEEDLDPEIEGVAALRQLRAASTTAAQSNRETAALSNSPPSSADTTRRSTPLVPLEPAQKRSTPRSIDRSTALRATGSGVHKVSGAPFRHGSLDRGDALGSPGMKKLTEHLKSLPEQGAVLERDLRGSKSAPDLGAHALAALRSFQAGNLQLDSKLRLKIAAAAKKVLQERQIKRNAGEAGAAAAPGQQRLSRSASQDAAARAPAVVLPMAVDSPVPCGGVNSPKSLATAAAISRGEPLPLLPSCIPASHQARLMRPETRSTLQQARELQGASLRQSEQVTPEPSSVSQQQSPSSAANGAHFRPFTVTTGVPRFAQGVNATTAAVAPSTPSTPSAIGHLSLYGSPPPARTVSLALTAQDVPPASTQA